jgi:hypothetical protein
MLAFQAIILRSLDSDAIENVYNNDFKASLFYICKIIRFRLKGQGSSTSTTYIELGNYVYSMCNANSISSCCVNKICGIQLKMRFVTFIS